MIATFKSEGTGVLNRSKIKASKYVDHGDLEGTRNRVYSTQGARFWCPSPYSNPISRIQLFQLMLSERPQCYVS